MGKQGEDFEEELDMDVDADVDDDDDLEIDLDDDSKETVVFNQHQNVSE